MWLLIIYAASVVVSYILQRIALKLDKWWYTYSFGLELIMTLVPFLNLIWSVISLWNVLDERNTFHPILWLYGIRGDDVQRVLEAKRR